VDLPSLARLARGPAPGLIAVSLFCLGLLVVSFRVSDNYYAHRLVAADSSYYLMSTSLVVSGGNDFAFRRLLEHPAPLVTSDGGTTVYVLHTLAAWWLRAVLPLRPAMAVVLNGVWLVAMALSVYALLWSRIRSWATATFVTIAYVLANPFFPSTTFGITSLDPNLGAFMLGTSALCWTVLSDRFQRAIPCLLVGLFLGFLCLARIYSLGVIGPAMLPYVVACFWRRPWREIWRSTQGGLLALGTAFVVGGWFVRANWQQLLKYPTQYGTAGVLNHTPLSEGIWAWLKFPRSVLAENLTLVCVMSWPLAVAVFGRARSLRHFNWSGLCAALAPLVVLAKMGTTFQPYGAASLFGVFMVLLFPFARPDPSLLYRGRFAAALSLACAFSCWSSFGDLHEAHSAPKDNKRGTVAALESLRDDALRAGRKRVTVGLVHWGTLHDASLVDSLVMDLKVRVATPDFRPRKRTASPLIVTTLATDPWAWDPNVAGAAVITPAAWTERIVQEADYVFVLAGDREQDRRKGRWPPWMEACDLIRESGVFRRLGAPFYAGSDGKVELLVRKEARRR
jgi:hypothetical protein